MTDVEKAKAELNSKVGGMVEGWYERPPLESEDWVEYEARLEAYVQARIAESLQKHGLDCYQCAPPSKLTPE